MTYDYRVSFERIRFDGPRDDSEIVEFTGPIIYKLMTGCVF